MGAPSHYGSMQGLAQKSLNFEAFGLQFGSFLANLAFCFSSSRNAFAASKEGNIGNRVIPQLILYNSFSAPKIYFLLLFTGI